MKLLNQLLDKLCGQPDLLKHSRSRALKELMALTEDEQRPAEVEARVA